MKKLVLAFLLLGFIMAGAVGAYVFHFVSSPASPYEESVIFDLPPGSAFQVVANRLQSADLVKDARLFVLYARFLGATTGVRVGEYELKKNMTPRQVLDVLSSGKSIERTLTVPEGFNIFEIAQVVEKTWPGHAKEFLSLAKDPKLTKELLGFEATNLEGYLFPETYSVTKYTSTEALIRMMVKNFFNVYNQIKTEKWQIQMQPHALVTFASIVEKETGVPEERPLIASVFHNRLQKRMRIQSDPTIIYGQWIKTGQYLENIQKKHILENTDYNTYTIPALPRGPISNPGAEALRATVNPATSEYLYFVSRNDGTHVFSKTLAEHNKAVKDFQLSRAARVGKSWRKRQ